MHRLASEQTGEGTLLQRGATLPVAGTSTTTIIGGDFNCVLSQADCTGNMNYTKALDNLVRGLEVTDVWETILPEPYTHYTPHGAERLTVCMFLQA